MELPFQQFFLGSIPVSLGNAKPRPQINLGLGKLYCQATGPASRRLLKSTAWLQSLLKRGIQGLPCGDCWLSLSVTDQNFQLCNSSASHTLCQESAWRHRGQKQESGSLHPVQALPHQRAMGRLLHPPAPDATSQKCSAQATCRVPSSSNLRFKVHFQSTGVTCITPGTEKFPLNIYRRMGRRTSLETKGPLTQTISGLEQRNISMWQMAREPQKRLGICIPSSMFFPIKTL